MIKLKTTITAAAFAVATFSLSQAIAGHHGGYGYSDKKSGHAEMKTQSMAAEKDIVAVAAGNESFTTLVAAVKAAGLVEVLQGDGPYTVFAPTNEAFAKLPDGTVEALLKPENRDQLVDILTYHVVPGAVYSSDVVKISEAKTVQGGKVAISAGEQGVMIENANVVAVDIDASNGVIHVIDTVIIPQKS